MLSPFGIVHMKCLTVYVVAASLISSLPFSASGSLIIQVSGQNEAYTVSSTDLLQTSLDSVADGLTLNVGENNGAGASTFAVLNNGLFGVGSVTPSDATTGKQESVVIQEGTITYTLDTSLNTLGYVITSIETYAGWADLNRGSQSYTVSLSLVGSATFTDLVTVSLVTDSLSQQKVSIMEDATGILATGVDAIRFTLPIQQFSGVGYKELDVTGYAVVPEPSTVMLVGLGLSALSLRRKRSRA
jgi:hypothetical protein